MKRIPSLLRDRNVVLLLALGLGLLLPQGTRWTERLVIPALAVVMTISTMGVSNDLFRSRRALIYPALAGIGMSYLILTGFLLGTSALVIREEAFWSGFVLVASVPPAVAVIPLTEFLEGNRPFSLMGTVGGYLAALVIMPLMAVGFLGSGFVDPSKLVVILFELILAPLMVSRIMIWTGIADRLKPIKGLISNWGFWIVVYTIVGLNRDVFFGRPLSLIPVACIAVLSTFLLGSLIGWTAKLSRIDPQTATSLVLLGTLKNQGLAGGLALALFSQQTAVPAAVSATFMIIYFIWLELKGRITSEGAL